MFGSPLPQPNTFPSAFHRLCRSQGSQHWSGQTKDVGAGFRSLAVMITGAASRWVDGALAVGIPLDQVPL